MFRWTFLAAAMVTAASLMTPCRGGAHAENSATAARLTAAQTTLAMRLIEKLGAADPRGNVIVSPASLAGALAAIELGADDQLRRQLHQVLGFREASQISLDFVGLRTATGRPRVDGPLAMANAIFFDVRTNPRPEAVEILRQAGVRVEVAAFSKPETLAAINGFVNEQTKGQIPTILDTMPTEAGLVALNALYFKDRWKHPFDAKQTEPAPFHLVGGKTLQIPLMRSGDGTFRFRQNQRFVAVELPYASEGYSLVLVTTRREPAAAKDFSSVAGWLTGDGFLSAPGEVALPRFAASSGYDLLPVLKSLGLRVPNALPGFARGELRLVRAQQRVEVAVDEEGTEAAATTAVTAARSAEAEFIRFNADKPFLFALRDHSGLFVVAGYVASPLAARSASSAAPTNTK